MKYTQDFSSMPLSIAFVDHTLDDLATLHATLSKDVCVHLLSHEKNILSQISDVMSELTEIHSIHIFTHASPGEIKLGSKGLSLETLPMYGAELMTMSSAMTNDGELYLYGCEVAAGERGAAFVEMLGDITGLKVAAATHKVGHTELGGSWELDAMPSMMENALHVSEWRGVLAAPSNGVYSFADAVDNEDGTYTTADGFFLIRGDSGQEVGTNDDWVYADGGGASVLGTTAVAASPFTTYIEVTPVSTGSFYLNSASLGDFYDDVNAATTQGTYTNFQNIYVVGLVNGVKVAETNKINSAVDTYDTTYTGFDFSTFSGKLIDTVRVYFDSSIGDLQDRLTLFNINISGASTTAAPAIPMVSFTYDANTLDNNFVNGYADEDDLGNTLDIEGARLFFGAETNGSASTQVYEIGERSGISGGTDHMLEYLSVSAGDAQFSLKQFKVYNDTANNITLTITGHADNSVYDNALADNPALNTTTATAVAGQWTTIDLPADFGNYSGFRIDSGSGNGVVSMYFNDFAIDVAPPLADLNGTDDGTNFSATLSDLPIALADTDAVISGAKAIMVAIDLTQLKTGDKLIFGDPEDDGFEVPLGALTAEGSDDPIQAATFGDTQIMLFNSRGFDPFVGSADYAILVIEAQDFDTLSGLIKTDMKFSGSEAGDRVFQFLTPPQGPGDIPSLLATATVTIEATDEPFVLDLDQVGDGSEGNNNSTAYFDWYEPAYFADDLYVLNDAAPEDYKKLTISFDTTEWTEDWEAYLRVADEVVDDTEDYENYINLGSSDGTTKIFETSDYGGSDDFLLTLSGPVSGQRTLTVENNEAGNSISKDDLNTFLQHIFFEEWYDKFSETRVFSLKATDENDNESEISTFGVNWAPDIEAPEFDGFANYEDFEAPIATDYFDPDNQNYISFYMDDDVTAVEGKYIKLWKVVDDGDDVVVGSYEVTDTDSVEIDGSQISFYPNLDTSLESGTSYYFTIDAGAFLDAALNEFEGFDALIDNEWSFSTAFPSLGTWNVADADPDSDGIQPTVSSTGAFRGNLEISANGKYVVMAEEVAYKESISSSSGVSVKMINPNGSWSYVGENAFASTSTSGGLYDLVVATNGETDTLYTVSVSNDNANAGPNTISTHMFKDGAWVQVGTNLSDNVGPFVSNFNIVMQPPKVVLLDGGIMMVAYSTNVGGVPKVEVKYGFLEQFEAEPLDATWQAAGTPIDPTTVKDAFDLISVGPEFLLGIASANSQDVKFYIPNGEGGWVDNMIPTLSMAQMSGASDQGATLKMAVDGNGVIYAVYGKNDSGLTDIAVSKFDITAATPAWVDLPAPADAKLSINEGGMRVDLVFDADNVPHLSLVGDGNVVDVYRFDEVNSNWRELDTGSSLDSIDSLPMADLEIHDGELSMLISKYGNELGMYLAEFEPSVDDTPDNSSVTLDVANPFTPENDTTAITIDAPDGVTISGATNSAVTGLPKNVKMPLGQFGFTLSGLANGATVEMSMTADADFKQFSYFKKNLVTNKWVNIMEGVTINDNGTPNDTSDDTATIKFSLTDGGVYDADRTVNGVIVDPGGVGENALLPMIAENTTEVGNISLLDNTLATGTMSYAITGGADAAKFTINASTGSLSFQSAPDYETPTDAGDTATNNTYAVQVTVTGSTSGSEVQNLIVSVLNVEEDGDNANTAPVIIGLRAEAQAVTAGTAVALDDIRVADVDGNTMTVTLSATNGTIGGLTDADANTAGIQLTGNAATINAALAAATFTASAAGDAGISMSIVDTATSGTAITTTAYYAMTAAAAATPPSGGGSSGGGSSTPPTTPTNTIINDSNLTGTTTTSVTQTVGANTVTTQSATGTRTYTDASGSTVTQQNVTVEAIKVTAPTSTASGSTTAVPLYWGESSKTEWATTASLSSGVTLSSEGNRAPTATQTTATAIDDLLYYIQTTVSNSDSTKANILGEGSSFLSALSNIGNLVVNKVTLSAPTTGSSTTPATISLDGTANGITTNGVTDVPKEALVIDASTLPTNSTILLNNIEFGVIVGENLTVRGGEGQNKIFTGEGSQDIMCGEDDDELHAGAGDDTVGSAGGDDLIFGEAGDDTVFGGEGNDLLHGGSGVDKATYTLNMSDYLITRDEGKTYVSLVSNPNEKDTLINTETIEFADATYTVENRSELTKIATLYTQILGRQAEIDGFQYWANNNADIGQIALGFITSQEYKTKSGVDFDTLDISAKIETFYEALLGRTSDSDGKSHWINLAQSGAMSIDQIANGFINSLEMQGIYLNKDGWDFIV